MDIFKENFPNNVINDLYKLCFQKYRASSIFLGQILVKNATNSTNTL